MDTIVERMRDTVVLMMNAYKDKVKNIVIVMNLEVTDYYFVDFLVFTEYKKFDTFLTKRTANKMNFIMVGWNIVRIAIEVGNKRVVDLTLQNVLYTLDLYSNLISILKVCGLDLDVQFGKNNVVAKFNNEHTTIYSR